ncbi:MAG: NAD kinase [Flavobacteriales bacterium]|jgi:NAD+ kinase|nr:NAD kinase [Flavobacteriales bacterium]MCB0759276.1 NAD kinase [Flavobacteriales bacterium]
MERKTGMRIGVLGRLYPASAAATINGILVRMVAAGATPVMERGLAERMTAAGMPPASDTEVMDRAEDADLHMLVSMGGDGSFLDSVDFLGAVPVPLLGINLGRLGFLSSTRLEDVDASLEAIMQRRYTLVERAVLALEGCPGFGTHNNALNEVSLHKRDGAAMISIHAHLDGRFLNTYWADGLIIATPTGSTAYSLSCGGPLLAPGCDAMVITPIAPHNLNVRPFVVPGNSTLTLHVDARGEKYLVNLDSRSQVLDHFPALQVHRAEHRVKLVQLEGQDFLNTLRSKLSWGLDIRSAKPGFEVG